MEQATAKTASRDRKSLREKRIQPLHSEGVGACKVVTDTSNKGGVAKTTSAETLALAAAKQGKRVLLVDLDDQMNLTNDLKHRADQFDGNIARVLETHFESGGPQWGEWSPSQVFDNIVALKYAGMGATVHLIPGAHFLSQTLYALDQHRRNYDPQAMFRLREALNVVRPYYDLIILDTAPAIDTLAGDLAYHASDVLMVPIDGLRACQGLVSVLRRVRAQHPVRLSEGFDPLHIMIFCAHFIPDGKAVPFGPMNIRNDDWYPLVCSWFPNHFIPEVVHHSTTLPRAIKSHNPLAAIRGKQRQEYMTLSRVFEERLNNLSSVVPLSTEIVDGSFDLNLFQEQVGNLLSVEAEQVELFNVRFLSAPALGTDTGQITDDGNGGSDAADVFIEDLVSGGDYHLVSGDSVMGGRDAEVAAVDDIA